MSPTELRQQKREMICRFITSQQQRDFRRLSLGNRQKVQVVKSEKKVQGSSVLELRVAGKGDRSAYILVVKLEGLQE